MVASIAVGRRFGPYEIREVLGKGASATVYLGRRSDGADVAVKVLSTFAMGNGDFRRAVPREFNALNKIDHPGVISVNKTGTIADVLFIEMEWVDGPTLDSILQNGKPLDLGVAVRIAAETAKALTACHEAGVVHRDVKPSNILLRSEEDPVLFDFGLAQDAEDPDAEPGRLYATPMTASPEQVLANGMIDGRADLYSLGVTLFRMLTGKLPFYGERMDVLRMHAESAPPDPRTINKGLADSLVAILDRALQKDPDDRYASAPDFVAALNSIDESDLIAPTRSRRLFGGTRRN